METICDRVYEPVLRKIDECIKKHNYSTRTDFVREAIRDKLALREKEASFEAFLGVAKKRVTAQEYERVRDRVFREYMKGLQ